MTEIEEIFLQHRPQYCEKCDGKMIYQDAGSYRCKDCGHEQLDDYGVIKQFLETHEGADAVLVSECTGVDIAIIREFLKDGRIQIPKASKFFISCERCGCALRHGRFCEDCTKELAGQLRTAFFEQMGEKPTAPKARNNTGRDRMHFLKEKK